VLFCVVYAAAMLLVVVLFCFVTKAAASVEKNCIEGKQPPEDGCMKPKHVVEEEEEYK
jgi:hypothetical protein